MSEKRSTVQKIAIRDTLYAMDDHPTATMVAAELKKGGHPVSRATVFRVLSDAADEGLVSRVRLCGEDVRYDCNTSPHYHLHCRVCGRIEDYTLPYKAELDNILTGTGFMIESHYIEFTGICAGCAKAADEDLKEDQEVAQ